MTYYDVCFWGGNFYTREVRPNSTTIYMDKVVATHTDPDDAQHDADQRQTEYENDPANWE
jgi:hypothetical protein